jgi:phosphohistidine swiveling domain-containing protein
MFMKEILSIRYIVSVLLLTNMSMSFLIAMDNIRMIARGSIRVGDDFEGKAFIVNGLDLPNKVKPGDIVVACTTNKSWDNILKNAAGIITEQGGSNSHAVALGKKFNIPVIVGVPEATKKIVHGSAIKVANKMVYETYHSALNFCIESSSINLPYVGKTRGSRGYRMSNDISRTPSTSVENKEKKSNVKKQDKLYYDGIPVTKERLLADMGLIRTDVTITTKNNIWIAWYTPKWTIRLTLTERAYDSIPYAFFDLGNEKLKEKDKTLMEEAFANLENDAVYIQETKEKFKKEILKNKTEIDNSEIAEFLYAQVVVNVSISDDLRKELIENPAKMDVLVRKNVINKTEYMRCTLRNFAVRYYLQKEEELKK